MGCKWLTHAFERVHWTAEQVVKFFEWLAQTSEWLTHLFERINRRTERVINLFAELKRTGEHLPYLFKQLIKWVPQMAERLTLTIISRDRKQQHFTTGHPVSSGMKALFASYRQ